jgi:hypothetical protein
VALTAPGPGGASVGGTFTSDVNFLNGIPHASFNVAAQNKGVGTWAVSSILDALADGIDDLFIICRYMAT